MMKLNDFRVGWRTLIQEPGYSLIVVTGLGVGLAACLLLLGFVRYSWQYNAHVPDVDNVYVLKIRYNIDAVAPIFDQAPYVLREAAMKAPGVTSVTGYAPRDGAFVRVGDHLHKLHGLPVLPGFAQMLGLQAIEGDVDAALEQPESFALTEDAAMRMFGTPHALGRTAQLGGMALRVAAVLRNPPANTTIPFEALIGVNSVMVGPEFRADMLTGARGTWGKLLIHVKPGSSLPAIIDVLQRAADTSPAVQFYPPEMKERLGKRKVMDIMLSPLRDAYFDRDVANNPISVPGDRGNPAVVAGLAGIALLILSLAAINYVNLSTVRVLRRQREIGMRKAVGASASQIALQFLAESLVVAMLATGLGLLLAWLALPAFSELMNRKLDTAFSGSDVWLAILIGIFLGMVSSVYPAWLAIRIRPAQALTGRPETESVRGRQVRRVMTVLQITTAMCLASITIAIAWQTSFAIHASPGFDPSPLLVIDIPDHANDKAVVQNFITALTRQPGVAGVAIAADAIGRSKTRWGLDMKREGASSAFIEVKSVGSNYFEQYRIKPVAGRLFESNIDHEDDPVPIVINAVAARALGFSSPETAVGQTLFYTGRGGKVLNRRVIGIAPELRFYSLHEGHRATAWELWSTGSTLSVRATKSISEVGRTVQALWPVYFPDSSLEMHPAGDILAANYDEDARIARLLAISTGIALAIAAFGTYALSAHTVQRRAKEIVLRKLYGARRRDIARLIPQEIGMLILVSSAVALPIAAVAIDHYLAGYVEHAPIGYWTLLLALASTLAIALTAAARHAWIAVHMKPSDVLRG